MANDDVRLGLAALGWFGGWLAASTLMVANVVGVLTGHWGPLHVTYWMALAALVAMNAGGLFALRAAD